jgi:hypothetical protein
MTRAQQAELEWAMRNRASLTKEQRAKYRAMWDEMNPPGSPAEERAPEDEIPYRNRATRPAPMEPSDLDPVEAAAAPITPDPVVKPKRPAMPKPSLTDTMESANTLASLDNFDAAFQSNGNHYPTAVAAFAQQLVARGVDPAYAQRAARARAEEHRSPYSQGVYAETMGATENPNELYAGYRNAPAGSPPGFSAGVAVLPDADPRTTRAERLAQSDRWAADVDRRAAEYNRDTGMPQPSGLAGADGYRDWSGWQPGDAVPERPRMGPTALESARADQDTARLDGIEAKYGPQARMIAERGDAEGVTDYNAVKTPGQLQKNAYRRQQELAAMWQGGEKDAKGNFLSPARADLRAQDERQSVANKGFRDQVAAATGAQDRRDKEQSRLERWQAISMLAGGSPSRQQVAMGNAFLNMPSDWQNAVSAKALRPDMDGTTPLTVDANSAKNAMRLLNADMIGQGGMGDMRQQMLMEQRREKAREFAVTEADKITGGMFWDTPLSPEDARRLKRRVEAIYPGMGGVVDSLNVAESPAPATPPNPTGGAI